MNDFEHKNVEGLAIVQNIYIDDAFTELSKVSDNVNIIELGTAAGGLTILLNKIFQQRIYTFDNNKFDKTLEIFKDYDIRFFYENIFDNQNVRELISEKKRCILLCDGGNKCQEWNEYAPLLKPNDIIMAHDYSKDGTFFYNKIREKYWNFHEIDDLCVQDSYKKYNLIPYMQEKFIYAVWKICIKK